MVKALPKSMTGYGRGEAIGEGKKFVVELKTVNHRFGEIMLKIPRGMLALEEKTKRFLQNGFARGRMDVFVNVEDWGERNTSVKIDQDLARSFYQALTALQKDLGLQDSITLEQILTLPNLISLEAPEEKTENFWPVLQEALAQALQQLLEMRETEGQSLQQDLLLRLTKVEELVKIIENRSPEVVVEYQKKLTQRLEEWLNEVNLDQDRLLNEVAFFADRCSITEELVRLYSHLEQGRLTLQKSEPIGRKMDFLLQEMNREINTIGSKASDLNIASIVVEIKSELEKIREQVQNLE